MGYQECSFHGVKQGQTSIHIPHRFYSKGLNKKKITKIIMIIQKHKSEKRASPFLFLSFEQKLDKLPSPFLTDSRNVYATKHGRAEYVHCFVKIKT